MLRIGQKGYHHSEKDKAKMREAKLKNPTKYWLGKKRPEVSTYLKQFKKGFTPWNKGKTKNEYPQLSVNKGKTNGMWRGGTKNENFTRLADSNWYRLRWQIYKHDHFCCQCCGKRCIKHDIQCHHIIPVAFGGDDNLNNLIVLCRRCHRKTEYGKLSSFWLLYFQHHIKISSN